MTLQLATSPDGQWVVARSGRQVQLLAAGAPPALARIELDSDDADLAIVPGPPNVVIAAVRRDGATRITLHFPPELDPTAHVDLPVAASIAAISGGRLVMVSADHKEVSIVRASGRGLASHPVDLQGGTIEFVAGIERNQLVVGHTRKLEVWDAVSGRPLRKLVLELPPPPRTIGTAAGHLWVTRPGSDEVLVYRLSDGRPFRHYVGAPVEHVIAHPTSPLVVLVTARGLVRLHCFAHSLFAIEAPWQAGTPTALAQLVIGEDISLLGMTAGDPEPWRVPIGGLGAAVPLEATEAGAESGLVTAADKLRAMREAPAVTPVATAALAAAVAPALHAITTSTRRAGWRDVLVTFGGELARGGDNPAPPLGGLGSLGQARLGEAELPVVAADTELGELAHRLGLAAPARRALIALYAQYLVGEPDLALARLAKLLGEWTEPLGQGQLGALALVERSGGRIRLATAVADALDGAAPREVRLAGGTATAPHAGAFRVARDGRTDATIEAELIAQLGRIAIVEGALAPALLEARLHGATAVTFAPPAERPRPWPQGAGLVLVLYGTASAWIADLPNL
ncbi:MAG: hypothetical protein ABI467_22370 [Kofleriaceae bacterium]